MKLHYFLSEQELGEQAAAYVAERAGEAINARGRFFLGLSGGKTPRAMLTALATTDVDWSRVTIFQVDERALPRGDSGRNRTLLEQSLLARLSRAPQTHFMPVEEPAEEARRAYEQTLRTELGLAGQFDLIHLGLGADGHTASLTPGDDAALSEAEQLVTWSHLYQGTHRLTLTFPALGRAREALWLVSGADKRAALKSLLAGDTTIPAARLHDLVSVVFALEDARP